MKVAIIGSRGFPSTYSGYETFLRYFVPHAVNAGHDVTVYCRWKDNGRSRWFVDGAECRWTLGVNSKSLSTLSYGLSSSIDVRSVRPDAVLVVNCANGLWLPLLRHLKLPTVVNVDGLEWQRGKWNATAKKVFLIGAELAARKADALVTDSVEIGRIWEEKFGVRSHFIPYGAPIIEDDDSDRLSDLGLCPGGFALTVGRLVPENNIDLTLDAFESLQRSGSRLPWVIVGSAVGRSHLEDRLRGLASAPTFFWLGHVSDQRLLTQLWRHCGLYVHGHSVGGTNPSLLQAMGAGAPIIAYDTPFNREVLTDRGIFYSDLSSLVARIEDVRRTPDLRSKLRQHGRERVSESYTWDGVCEGYLMLLAAVGSGGP